MKNEKKFVIDTLKNVYGQTDVAEAEYISDEDADQVDDEKVTKLFAKYDKAKVKDISTKKFDEGAQAREKKVRDEIEGKLKSKFAIEDPDLIGDELIDHIVTLKPKPDGKPGAVTEEAVKTHPLFIGLQTEMSKKLKDQEKEFTGKLTEKDKEIQGASLFQRVRANALTKLDSKNPILPKDAAKAEKVRETLLVNELKGHKFQEQDGKIIPLKADGTAITDEHGNTKDLDTLLDEIIDTNFEFALADERSGAGNGKKENEKGADGKPLVEAYSKKLPANADEYLKLITEEGLTVEEKISLKKQWNAKAGK